MDPIFFTSPEELRAWLEQHHDSRDELWIGLYKKATGRPTLTWPELVDEALCFGWIDGLLRRIDDESHMQRLTPRRKRSIWSARNIERVAELTRQGRMHPAGIAAFEARDPKRSEIYGHERNRGKLTPAYEKRIRVNKEAWAWFSAQSESYRRTAGHWVMSAKREETRERRLKALIEDSAAGERVKPLRR